MGNKKVLISSLIIVIMGVMGIVIRFIDKNSPIPTSTDRAELYYKSVDDKLDSIANQRLTTYADSCNNITNSE